VNQQVTLDGESAIIIGVMPPNFQYPRKIEIWTATRFDPAKWTYRGNGTRFVNVLTRLKPGVSFAAAQEELRQIGDRLQREYPGTDDVWKFGSEPLRDYLYGAMKPALLLLLAASGVLLLIACINVANLQLSRATARTREVALRRALGATQARILAQFLTESTLLSLFGGAIGLFFAFSLVHWLGAKLPGRLSSAAVGLDWPTVWFAVAVSVGTGIVFGLAPALQSRRVDLNANLKRGDLRVGGASGDGLRSAFISVEVALSLVLLVGASLLANSLWRLIHSPLGFQPDQVLTFEIKLPWNKNADVGRRFYDELRDKIKSLPGVTAVGEISALPTVDWHLRSSFDVDWRPRTASNDTVNVEDRHISGDYLEAMRIPILTGRNFAASDMDAKKLMVLVNRQFARQYLPNGNLIGRRLINNMAQFEIIGVTGDVRGTAGSIAQPAGPEVYFLADGSIVGRTVVVRSHLSPEPLIRTIREQVRELDPRQAIRNVATLEDRLNESVAQPRFNMGLLTAFAAFALLLACVGIYGVVSYSVNQRSVEIGIRMALGASPAQISALFLARALFPAGIGLAAGGVIAFSLTRLLQSELYNVRPHDPVAFGISIPVLLIPVLLASLRPSLRAAAVNPVDALRRD
jgi:predicted permease